MRPAVMRSWVLLAACAVLAYVPRRKAREVAQMDHTSRAFRPRHEPSASLQPLSCFPFFSPTLDSPDRPTQNYAESATRCSISPRGGQEVHMDEQGLVQRAYTAVTEHFVKTGRAPHYTELAETLHLGIEEARQLQHRAADSAIACWFVKDTDYVESWAPFSNVPTHFLITVGGEQKWYGQ